jgi:hypothetical protein
MIVVPGPLGQPPSSGHQWNELAGLLTIRCPSVAIQSSSSTLLSRVWLRGSAVLYRA